MTKKTLIFLSVIALLLVAIWFISFERKDVPDINWWNGDPYGLHDKEPHGGYVIGQIMKDVYGEEITREFNSTDTLPLSYTNMRLGYFSINETIPFSKSKIDNIKAFVAAGNDALIIGQIYYSYESDSLFSELIETYEILTRDPIISAPNGERYQLPYFYNSLDSSTQMSIQYLDTSIYDHDHEGQVLSLANELYPIFYKIEIGEGNLYIHTVPYAFSNISMLQDRYRQIDDLDLTENANLSEYAMNVLPLLDIDSLYLDEGYTGNYDNTERDQTPLEFVFSNPPIKWAYYVTLFGVLMYLLSRGLRRQKTIPVLYRKENTSMEYIDTLSNLYLSQGQHDKLAVHFKEHFLHFVKKKYYIKEDDPKFDLLLAKKSSIPINDIERIQNRIQAAIGNARFDAEQLHNLHFELEKFYKNCR